MKPPSHSVLCNLKNVVCLLLKRSTNMQKLVALKRPPAHLRTSKESSVGVAAGPDTGLEIS